jgi:branched-chain amino acid transport system ATP-binding protein
MAVVMDICDRVIVLDYGRKIADGSPDQVRADQGVVDAYLGVSHD